MEAPCPEEAADSLDQLATTLNLTLGCWCTLSGPDSVSSPADAHVGSLIS